MDRLLRIGVGVVAIAIVVAIVYGWTYIHAYVGLMAAHYMYAFAAVLGLYLAYVVGDLLLLTYDIKKDKRK
jgi:hypothetical protein